MKKKNNTSVYAPRESTVFTEFTEQNSKKKGYTTAVVVCIAVAVLAVFLAVIVYSFFRVETIIIDGVNCYSYENLLETAGISKGQSIFFVSENSIKSKLTKKLSYVHDVSVEIKFPSEIHIEIDEEVPSFYFEMDKEYFLINSEMKVLERFVDQNVLIENHPDVMMIKIPEVGKAITCEKVEFVSDFYSRHTADALSSIRKWERFDKLTEIDLSNRFELSVVYDGRIRLSFGSYTDFADKLELAEKMIDYYPSNVTGTFILSDVDKGIAQIDSEE